MRLGRVGPNAAMRQRDKRSLVRADVVLPAMEGNDFVRRAKDIHPGLPALLVSGMVSSYERAAAADAFLPKGACTPAEMLDRIRVLVTRKRGPKKHSVVLGAGLPATI